MRKGHYPAEEHFSFSVDIKDSKDDLANVGISDRETKRDEMREQFIGRIDFVTNLWKEANESSVASFSYEDFKRKTEELSVGLGNTIEDFSSKKDGVFKIKQDINVLIDSIIQEKEVKNKNSNFYTNEVFLNLLIARLSDSRDKLADKLKDSDCEFIYYVTNFLDNLLNKKHAVESLKTDNVQLFLDRLSKLTFENNSRGSSPGFVTENMYAARLIEILKSKINKGEDVLNTIDFGNFDVIFNLGRIEFVHGYVGKEFDFIRSARGFHISKTPIIVIVNDTHVDDINYVIEHERGHNLVSSVENEDIHTAIYSDQFLISLRKNKEAYKENLEAGFVEKGEILVGDHIESMISNLSAEISADARNLVKGYPGMFLVYFKNAIEDVYKYINNNTDTKDEYDKKFDEFVREKITNVIETAKKLVLEMVIYAHLARKHSLEDEFCATLIIMPTSTKYLKRLFEAKLGKVDMDEVKKEIDPNVVFKNAPEWLKPYVSSYFE